MQTNRRRWLQAVGLASAGLFLPGKNVLASALSPQETEPADTTIRLNANENPYGPSSSAREAMKKQVGTSNRYPWPMISSLISDLAAKNKLSNDNVLVGAGSSQIIDTVIQLAAQQKGSFILAKPTFSRWSTAAEKAGLLKIEVPLTENKLHDLAAMQRAIRPDTRLIYICNPNNPTGTISDYTSLVSFIKETAKHSLVMVDEAYLDYTNESSLSSLVNEHENLVVVKTFSKVYGLAGARTGYALAHPKNIERLQELQSGANIGICAMSLAGAMSALRDEEFVLQSVAMNKECSKFTINALERQGIACIPSHTNFIYFSLAHYKKDFFARLKEHNIKGTEIFEAAGKWSRITIGTQAEMQKFIDAVNA